VTLPATGAPTFIYPLVLLGLGLALLAGGLTLRKRRLA
jgi:LPXTG-motif cell wall-anchored protein